MKQSSLKFGALVGAVTSVPLLALLYLGDQFAGLPFVPFSLFDWLARNLPGDVITLGIDAMVDLINLLNLGSTSSAAKTLEQALALLLFIAGATLLGTAIAWFSSRVDQPGNRMGAIVGFVAYVGAMYVTFSLTAPVNTLLTAVWLALLFIGWGIIIGRVIVGQSGDEMTDEGRAARRATLIRLAAGSAGVAVTAWGLGRLLNAQTEDTGAGRPLTELAPTPSKVQPAQDVAPTLQATAEPGTSVTTATRDQVPPAPGTRMELTPNEQFYRIDINTRPPVIDEESWALEVAGLFENPRVLSLEDLMAYPQITQPITLSCISNRVGGDLIGTSNWTGARLRDVLADLGLQPEAKGLLVEASDGFFESVDLDDMMDPRTLLVYGMNDETLPVEHGFPLRIYRPDRYGMKQPKWIVRMTAIEGVEPGYWVVRGWSKEARPQIVSVIDSVAIDQQTDDGRIPIGGIAWAGDRGIRKVELQIDDGDWLEATLRKPPLSPLTWFQWRYDWDAEPGGHVIRVRATDGTGALQIEEEQGVRPDGATGYHSRRVRV